MSPDFGLVLRGRVEPSGIYLCANCTGFLVVT